VICMVGDGSAMYTLQSLWTQAREELDITTIVFANRKYQILLGEFAGVDAGEPGQRALDMLNLDRPALDWVSLAKGMGVPGVSVSNVDDFNKALANAIWSYQAPYDAVAAIAGYLAFYPDRFEISVQ